MTHSQQLLRLLLLLLLQPSRLAYHHQQWKLLPWVLLQWTLMQLGFVLLLLLLWEGNLPTGLVLVSSKRQQLQQQGQGPLTHSAVTL